MRRYLAPLVLALWAFSLALGGSAQSALWMGLLVCAVITQVVAHRHDYRRRDRRSPR